MESLTKLQTSRGCWRDVTESLLQRVPARSRVRHLSAVCDASGSALPLPAVEVGTLMYQYQLGAQQEVSGAWLLCKAEAELWQQRASLVLQHLQQAPGDVPTVMLGTQQTLQVEYDADSLHDTGELHFVPCAKLQAYILKLDLDTDDAPALAGLPCTFNKVAANSNGWYVSKPMSAMVWKVRISTSGGTDFHCSSSRAGNLKHSFWTAVLLSAQRYFLKYGRMPRYVPLPIGVTFVNAT
jgi:hypothetical protein